MLRSHLSTLILIFSSFCVAQQAGKGLTPLPAKPQASDFVLNDLDDNPHSLSDYHGQVVIINFWATWCPPCREEMPSMQSAWEQLEKEGILMFGIDVGEDEDTIFQFMANYPVEFPILLDQDSKVINRWPVLGLPTTFVVDPDGKIAYRAIGGREWDAPDLLAQIRGLKQ